MRAAVITRPGGTEVLEVQPRPDPVPAPHEVRISVTASALNRADISQRVGRYPAPHGSPQDIPGLEYAGEVESVGSAVTMWRRGDRVMGIVGGGAHAELLCAHEREVMPAPLDLDLVHAAAIPEVFLTAFDAMAQLAVRPGETMIVHAAGSGVGTAAVQLARIAGIRTIGTSRTADKLEKARSLGMDIGVTVLDDEWPQAVVSLAGERGVDAILDLVGAGYLSGNLKVLRPRGRMISVGLTSGSRGDLDMGLVMRKRLTLIGTVLRARPIEEKIIAARRFSDQVVPHFSDGRLVPVIDRIMSFDEIRSAHALMESNSTFGKIVLRWS